MPKITNEQLVNAALFPPLSRKKLVHDLRISRESEGRLEAEVTALEALRPVWAQGFTDDSTAAQSMQAALAQIWGMLQVYDQTAAVRELSKLLKELQNRRALDREEVWYWQGDGEDRLGSLTCPIVIEAADLRVLLSGREK